MTCARRFRERCFRTKEEEEAEEKKRSCSFFFAAHKKKKKKKKVHFRRKGPHGAIYKLHVWIVPGRPRGLNGISNEGKEEGEAFLASSNLVSLSRFVLRPSIHLSVQLLLDVHVETSRREENLFTKETPLPRGRRAKSKKSGEVDRQPRLRRRVTSASYW